jgi:uncharacterized protein (UPF0248 family)
VVRLEITRTEKNKRKMKKYIWENLKRWRKKEEKWGYQISEEETGNELTYFKKRKKGEIVERADLFHFRFTENKIIIHMYVKEEDEGTLEKELRKIKLEKELYYNLWGTIIPFEFDRIEDIKKMFDRSIWTSDPGKLI